jgi:hypothetical protein
MHHGGGHGRHFQFNRIHRGGFVGRQFFGGQFVINNWGFFGFSEPPAGSRWIRYYDDALLIDGSGRVLDGRYDFDWDRYGGGYGDGYAYGDGGASYGEDMDSEEYDEDDMADGRDRGDYDHDDDADRHGDRVVRVERRVIPRGHMGPPMPMPPLPPGYGGGYGGYGGYGYGYGYGGLVIVTETTVNPAPVVETRTVYETVVERVRVAPRVRHRPRCVCSRPAPRPRPGERG